VIGTYVEWLQDPEYEPPVCLICKDPISEDNVLRLTCLHMFHPECLDVHCSSFPPNTAKAGFTCPACVKPIIPPPGNSSMLVQLLNTHLETAPWLEPRIEGLKAVPFGSQGADETRIELGSMALGPRDEGTGRAQAITATETAPNPGSHDVAIDIPRSPAASEGIASRKMVRTGGAMTQGMAPDQGKGAVVEDFDADDDKYRKHSVMQLFKGSTPSKDAKPLQTKKARSRKFTSRGALVLFALLSILATMIVLHLSLTPPE